jgi:predicted regulator of Ras-like GTPase activity (Roadblock/LC7/MglB family)
MVSGESSAVSFNKKVDSMKGSLASTSVADLIQFLNSGGRTGEFVAKRTPDGLEARLYFIAGNLVHVTAGTEEGMPALREVAQWRHGAFRFTSDVLSPRTTLEMSVQHALIEALRLEDESRNLTAVLEDPSDIDLDLDIESAPDSRTESTDANQRRNTMRSSTDVLEDCLKIPGISSAVVIGRDGFLIEAAGGSNNVNLETLGASLAHAVNGVEEMGNELQVAAFQDLFVEYGRAVIICRPVSGAIIAIVAPDASKLGIIRHKINPLVEELANFF